MEISQTVQIEFQADLRCGLEHDTAECERVLHSKIYPLQNIASRQHRRSRNAMIIQFQCFDTLSHRGLFEPFEHRRHNHKLVNNIHNPYENLFQGLC